jgi:hypothetical protein
MSKYEDDWFGPDGGILARGKPLMPRSQGSDLPTRPLPRSRGGPPSPAEEYLLQQKSIQEQHRQRGQERFNELKQDYPLGSGYPETAPSFPSGNPNENPTASILQQQGNKMGMGLEDISLWPKQPLPPEFEPQRPIPLGEIQRKWGVPRMEDL